MAYSSRLSRNSAYFFSSINVSRNFELNAEDSLLKTNTKFEQRFRYIEKKLKEHDKALKDATLEEIDDFWNEAKEVDLL